jgi:hypothetical protein
MNAFSHVVFLIITLIFPPFGLVWLCCAVSASNKRKRLEDRRRDEQIELLKIIANQGKGNK